MKKVLAIAMAIAIAFTIGYAIGKGGVQSQPISWVDETGETYFEK